MTNPKPITKKEIEERINEAVQQLYERLGFKFDPSEVSEFLAANAGLPPEKAMPKTMEFGLALGFGSFTDKFKTGIKTREDLEKVLQTIGEVREQAPTLVRSVYTQAIKNLPRRGGPGRIPKLDARESVVVCNQILQFIGRKYTVKQALAKTSEMCPTLLGKAVSQRTLQKAWDKRDEFLGS
jgi:hypothetical protein